MDPLVLTVDALAAYRLTRLVTADVIAEPVRRSVVMRSMGDDAPDSDDAPAVDHPEAADVTPTALEVVESLDDPPKLARLITCRWCAGIWIAGGVVAARRLAPRAWDPVATAMALSAVAVLLARAETD